MIRVSRSCVVPLVALTAAAWAVPVSQMGTVTSAQVATEALEQQRCRRPIPARCNALSEATGKRIRSLPIGTQLNG